MSMQSAQEAAPRLHATGTTPDRLTIFAWLWACQALVHQEFYSGWLKQGDVRGWIVTGLALATLLRPSSLPLLCSLLAASIVYNVAKWPFVVNHILLESLINATILAAVASVYLNRRVAGSGPTNGREAPATEDPPRLRPSGSSPGHSSGELSSTSLRDQIVDRFAPVVTAMIVIMYWFAFIAKLNADFVNPDVSCVTAMYGDLTRRLPFLPDTRQAHVISIALTLLVEGLIPLLLSFRRTRPLAVLIGLPFHFVLGLVGHRTFSGLAFAIYGLLILDSLTVWAQTASAAWQQRFSPRLRMGLYLTAAIVVPLAVAGLISADLAGRFRTRIGGVAIYQLPWGIWISWSLLMGSVLGWAIFAAWRTPARGTARLQTASPGWLWSSVGLVVVIGLSPYVGLKTETCFTMYSNLRTEANWNNHFFMPAWKLGPWQTDLAQIVKTDHPELTRYVERGDLITYFELRRIVSLTPPGQEFHVEYLRRGESHVLAQTAMGRTHTAGEDPHPEWLGRLLYFRPISTEVCMPCRH